MPSTADFQSGISRASTEATCCTVAVGRVELVVVATVLVVVAAVVAGAVAVAATVVAGAAAVASVAAGFSSPPPHPLAAAIAVATNAPRTKTLRFIMIAPERAPHSSGVLHVRIGQSLARRLTPLARTTVRSSPRPAR